MTLLTRCLKSLLSQKLIVDFLIFLVIILIDIEKNIPSF